MMGDAALWLDQKGVAVWHGDVLDAMRQLADESVAAVITDPPYGLSREPDMAEVLQYWLTGDDSGYGQSLSRAGGHESQRGPKKGFMGREWDAAVPGPAVWREAYRVLKPGAHMFVFAGTRTADLMGLSLRLAGFEIRDTITWIYSSGFPKSTDVGRVTGDERWAGWGTALKPASEPILMVRKPRIGTTAANVLAHGTGALNIDATRVSTVPGESPSELRRQQARDAGHAPGRPGEYRIATLEDRTTPERFMEERKGETLGRFPPNVVLSHAPGCDEDGPCQSGCPVAELDAQSGIRKAGGNLTGNEPRSEGFSGTVYGDGKGARAWESYNDTGGSSRMFPTFRFTSKAGGDERPAYEVGPHALCTHVDDVPPESWPAWCRDPDGSCPGCARPTGPVAHETVKPLDLMRWLVRLAVRTGDDTDAVVLDLYSGSGTTTEAAIIERVPVIAVEKRSPYLPLIQQRIIRGRYTPRSDGPRPPRPAQLAPEQDVVLFDVDDLAG